MCGRFSNKYTWRELYDLYALTYGFHASDWQPIFNIPPTTRIPVIRFIEGQRRIDLMRWGLVPSWSKEIGKFATFNARSDGCTEKPTYRGAWKAGRRCIIPASSFFEWRKADKHPFAIGLANGGPMAFAGLWEEWKPRDGEPLLSCTVITTFPNKLMREIHVRMPVILSEENWGAWLGEEPAEDQPLRDMLVAFQTERMTAWPVSKDVGHVKNQGAHLVEPEKS